MKLSPLEKRKTLDFAAHVFQFSHRNSELVSPHPFSVVMSAVISTSELDDAFLRILHCARKSNRQLNVRLHWIAAVIFAYEKAINSTRAECDRWRWNAGICRPVPVVYAAFVTNVSRFLPKKGFQIWITAATGWAATNLGPSAGACWRVIPISVPPVRHSPSPALT